MTSCLRHLERNFQHLQHNTARYGFPSCRAQSSSTSADNVSLTAPIAYAIRLSLPPAYTASSLQPPVHKAQPPAPTTFKARYSSWRNPNRKSTPAFPPLPRQAFPFDLSLFYNNISPSITFLPFFLGPCAPAPLTCPFSRQLRHFSHSVPSKLLPKVIARLPPSPMRLRRR